MHSSEQTATQITTEPVATGDASTEEASEPRMSVRRVQVASVPSENPGSGEVKLVARAGGDRASDGTVNPLAGAAFSFYQVADAVAVTGGTIVGSCTTDTTGLCGVIASLGTSGQTTGYFYAVQTAVPAGWTVATTWGTSTDYVRYNTGQVTEGNAYELPGTGRSWPAVRDNPALAQQCLLSIGLVLDVSHSLTQSSTNFGYFKAGVNQVATTLQGTFTHLTVYTFATAAPAAGTANATLFHQSVESISAADAARAKVTNLTATPTEAEGHANWDQALHQSVGGWHDAVVLVTDGSPTVDRSNPDGLAVTLRKMEEAIHSANAVKAGGSMVISVGGGSAYSSSAEIQRLKLVSGPTSGDDHNVGTNWSTFQSGPMTVVANQLDAQAYNRGTCPTASSTVTMVSQPRSATGDPLPASASGWTFTVRNTLSNTATPKVSTTDADGRTSIVASGAENRWEIDIVGATKEGFAPQPNLDGTYASCISEGYPVRLVNRDGGFRIVDLPMRQTVECTVVHTAIDSTYTPSSSQVAVVVRAGGDRLPDGSVAPLAGSSFEVYLAGGTGSVTAISNGHLAGTCITGADGSCRVIVALESASGYHTLYAVNTGVPPGWSLASTWGTSTQYLNYNVGRALYGGETGELPGPGRSWPAVRDNPAAVGSCGLDIAIVADLSDSVARSAEVGAFDAFKAAAAGVVDMLEGTPSTMTVYSSATLAPAAGSANSTLAPTAVTRTTGASTVRTKLLGLQATPVAADGYANWDEGLAQAAYQNHDLMVFLTGGGINASRSVRDGGSATIRDVEDAIHSANAVKAGGTRVVVAGAGSGVGTAAPAHRLSLISGPTLDTDHHVDTDWTLYDDTLRDIALEGCAGSVSIVKDVRDGGGVLTPGSGIAFEATVTQTGTVTTGTTSTDGALSFAAQAVTGNVTIEETTAGYAIEQQGGANATCATTRGSSVPVTNTTAGFIIDTFATEAVVCTVINTQVAGLPSVSIAKTSPHDVPDPDRPVVPAGQDVTWSYTVTNTGTIELTSLLVSDDRGVTVTCPGGNPLPSLAPGASVVCTGTGPVTPDTAPAPKTATLTDDFSAQNTTSWIWGTGVGTTSGYLALGIDSSFPTLTSRIGYDLTSSSVCVHAEPASMMGDQTFLSLGGSGDVWTPGNDLQILQSENQLFFREIVGGVVSETAIPYDPDNETQHAWWRIREDAGIIYWQTSSDALTWTTHRTKTAAFAVDSVRIHLRAGNPVTAARFSYFDNFNLCPPPPPPPPAMTSLFDTFAGQDTTKWSGWGMTAMVSAGRLQVSNLSTYPALTSSSTYTMRGSSLCARVYAGTGTASNSNIMSVGGTLASHTAANTVQILYRQGLIVFRIRDGGGVASDLSMSYSASVHAWWRIREDGGTLYWETSSDGSTWVPRRTIATPAALPLDAVRVRLYAGNDGGMNGGYTYYDNVNSCPGM